MQTEGTPERTKDMDLFDPLMSEFQFYNHPASTVKSLRTMTLLDVYNYITLDNDALTNTRLLRAMEDVDERKKFKAKNFCFACFSGTFSYRKDDCLLKHSGLICIDFDHIGNSQQLAETKKALIEDEIFETQLLFTSPSGDGLKWVVDIDLGKCDHRTWFYAIQNYVLETYHLEADSQCVNVSRSCFLPHDGSCYVNPIIRKQKGVCPF